jgi:hypothetical protein
MPVFNTVLHSYHREEHDGEFTDRMNKNGDRTCLSHAGIQDNHSTDLILSPFSRTFNLAYSCFSSLRLVL